MHEDELPPEIEAGFREMSEAVGAAASTAELVVGAAEMVGGLPFALLPDEVAEAVLATVASAPGSGDVLAALAFVAGPPLAERAAARLAADDGHAPRGLDLGKGRVHDVMLVEHPEDPASIVVGLVSFPGESEAVVVTALVDALGLRGGVADGSVGLLEDVATDLPSLRESLAQEGAAFTALDVPELVARLRAGIAASAEVGIAPPPSAFASCAILLGAAEPGAVADLDALVGLPMLPDAALADVEDDEPELTEEEAAAAEKRLDELASDFSDAVIDEDGEEAGEVAWEVASQLDAFAVQEAGVHEPPRWTRDLIRIFLLDWAPAEGPFLPGTPIASTTARYLRYLARHDELAEPVAEALARYADNLEEAAVAGLADKRRWSHGKALTAAMLADDLDLDDPGAVSAWIDDFNARTDEERAEILGNG